MCGVFSYSDTYGSSVGPQTVVSFSWNRMLPLTAKEVTELEGLFKMSKILTDSCLYL